MINTSSLFVDRAGVIRPDLIPLAAFLCAEEYDDYARSLILDHAAAGAPLRDLTIPAPGSDGWRVLEPCDLAGAEEALRRGGPAPAVEPVEEIPAPRSPAAPRRWPIGSRPRPTGFRRSGSPLAGFIADQLERLAQVVAFTGAQSPQDFADRLDVHERDLLASEYDRGFADGRSRTAGYCPR